METTELLLSLISRTSDTQARAALNTDAIAEYRRLLEEGHADKCPPVDLFFDGADYHIGDGWHRFEAHFEAGLESISCRIRRGSERDARLFACSANQKHGVRRTLADRRRAIELVLADDEWSKKSDRLIAEFIGADHHVVSKVRKEREESTGEVRQLTEGRDGKMRRKPIPRTKQEATSPAETNGHAATAVAEPEEKLKSGREKITAEKRKEARKGFGVARRFVDACRCADEAVQCDVLTVDGLFAALSQHMHKHWG